jgi:hypothetical protein
MEQHNQPEHELDRDDLWAEGWQDGATQGRVVAERVADMMAIRFTTALIPDAQKRYSRAFLLSCIAAFRKEMRLRMAVYRDAAANAKRSKR